MGREPVGESGVISPLYKWPKHISPYLGVITPFSLGRAHFVSNHAIQTKGAELNMLSLSTNSLPGPEFIKVQDRSSSVVSNQLTRQFYTC